MCIRDRDIIDNVDSAANEDFGMGDTLVLNNLQQNQVLFTRLENTSNLLISVKNSTDTILLVDFFDDVSSMNIAGIEAIERIQFSDNVTLDKAAIIAMLPTKVIIEGTTGGDILQGGVESNIYVINHIRDVIIESANPSIDTVESSLSHVLGLSLIHISEPTRPY